MPPTLKARTGSDASVKFRLTEKNGKKIIWEKDLAYNQRKIFCYIPFFYPDDQIK